MTRASTARGSTTLEALVSFTLLTSVLSLALPLVVQNGRLLGDQRDYRLALDELSNHLDRLTALTPEELPAALEQLALSEFARSRLHGAELNGASETIDIGTRVTLRLSWDSLQRRTVTLSAWVVPAPQASGNQSAQEAQP